MRISAVRIFFLETWYVVIGSIFSFFFKHKTSPNLARTRNTNKQTN